MKVFRGFGVIEFMIVVVLLGIMAAIAIPNFIVLDNQKRERQVRENMKLLQGAAEMYFAQHAVYPAKLQEIEEMLPEGLVNPFNQSQPAVVDLHQPPETWDVFPPGVVLLSPRRDGAPGEDYVILGVDRKGKPFSNPLTKMIVPGG